MYLIKRSLECLHINKKLLHLGSLKYFSVNLVFMEKAMEKIIQNPYYEKYANKISKLKVISPEDFLSRTKKLSNNSVEKSMMGHDFSKVAEKPKSAIPISSYAFAPQKKLSSIMKTELLKDCSAEEIKYIWTQHFLKKDAISGSMSTAIFEKIQERAVKFPMFIFPLPRSEGYELIYVQFAANEIHFTPLINYQAYQENAPECLTIFHYPDLSEDKGLVLMHGDLNKDALNTKEAQFLANQIALYYAGDDAEKLSLMERFHNSPSQFKHTDLIDHIEKLNIGALAATKS